MVTFRHDSAGATPAFWQDRHPVETLPPLDVPDRTRLLLLAAHPDDETLGAAGLAAEVLAGGGDVQAVIVSDGENSHPRSATWTPAALAAERRREVGAALAHLGLLRPARHLGIPDGRLDRDAPALRTALTGSLAGFAPTWIAAPWRGDRHPDHEALGLAGAALAAELEVSFTEYPIWFWHWGDQAPDVLPWDAARALPMSDRSLALKRAALDMHRTQTRPLSDRPGDEVLLSATFLAHFSGATEIHLAGARHRIT